MLPPPFENSLVLTGPTGSGKTALGVELAERLGAEIISMDSMALYRRMDIGTAKPTSDERQRVPHHLIDVREPWESSSVAWWLDEARRVARDLEARGKKVLFVGGTPLYLKALIFGLFTGPGADANVRRRLEEEAETLGSIVLHRRLTAIDAASAARIHANDARRIIRALEVHEITGKPMSAWQTQWSREAAPAVAAATAIFWLDLPREELYERINRRVEAMFQAGLVEEVLALAKAPQGLSREARQALGYKDVLRFLEAGTEPTRADSLDPTIAHIQQRTRNFAKRQITWFRHLPGCRPSTRENVLEFLRAFA